MTRLNCIGDICPVPVIKTKRVLAEATDVDVEIVVDNEIAVQNITKFLKAGNYAFTSQEIELDDLQCYSIMIKNHNQVMPLGKPNTSSVVVVSSQYMGSGDDILGTTLMKGFFYSLTQLDELPAAVIFYNGGIFHALSGADAVQDLTYLSEHGVQILTCGACLNYHNAADKLAVGEITDMYTIVTLLQNTAIKITP